MAPFHGRAFVVQVAGVAGFFKAEVLSGIRQGLARGGLLRFLVGRACLAVGAAILGAGPVAGFAAYPGGEFAGVVKGVAAFLAPAVNVTAHAVLVLGVVFLGIQLGLLLGLSLGVGLERVHGLGVGGVAPGFSLALVTGTAFLATFKRLRGRAGGEDRKHGCCGKGECQGMAHGFLLRAIYPLIPLLCYGKTFLCPYCSSGLCKRVAPVPRLFLVPLVPLRVCRIVSTTRDGGRCIHDGGGRDLVDPVAALLVDELQDGQVQRHGVGEGQHLGDEGVAALGIAQEVAAHHAVGEGLQGVGFDSCFPASIF